MTDQIDESLSRSARAGPILFWAGLAGGVLWFAAYFGAPTVVWVPGAVIVVASAAIITFASFRLARHDGSSFARALWFAVRDAVKWLLDFVP